jgi:hypothetical protein
MDDSSNYFNSKGIEFLVIDLKVLEQDFNELELIQDDNKGRVSFNNY